MPPPGRRCSKPCTPSSTGWPAASWRGADYLFHGPVFATPSKQELLEPIGLAGLARACARTDRPILALGGVRPAHVGELRAAGAHGVAVLSGILGASDPGRATAAYLEALAPRLLLVRIVRRPDREAEELRLRR